METATHHALDRPVGAVSAGRQRVAAADGLRGLAALAIVVHHSSFQTGYTFRRGVLAAVFARLDVGVPVFFGLSGFLLFQPYLRRIVAGEPMGSIRGFYRRRFVRIFPAYWVALFVQIALGVIAVGGGVGLFLTMTLTHPYVGQRALTGIVQSWSLTTEVGFYLVLPLFALLAARVAGRRSSVQSVLVVTLLCATWIPISTLSRGLMRGLRLPWAGNFRFLVVANADYFAIGMLVACLVVGSEVSPRIHDLRVRIFRSPTAWYAMSLFVLWLVATQLPVPRGLEAGSAKVDMLRQLCYFLVALFAVAPACCAGTTGVAQRFLTSRPLVWLGVVSYGVYLWHQVFLSAPGTNGFLLDQFGWHAFHAPLVPVVALTVAGSLVLGAASWYLLERPLLKRFR
jgi:peptidoglycan/LPS O-acetylase OafA/YrhL